MHLTDLGMFNWWISEQHETLQSLVIFTVVRCCFSRFESWIENRVDSSLVYSLITDGSTETRRRLLWHTLFNSIVGKTLFSSWLKVIQPIKSQEINSDKGPKNVMTSRHPIGCFSDRERASCLSELELPLRKSNSPVQNRMNLWRKRLCSLRFTVE